MIAYVSNSEKLLKKIPKEIRHIRMSFFIAWCADVLLKSISFNR